MNRVLGHSCAGPLRDELVLGARRVARLGPLPGALERSAGLGEEDVVEARGVELEVGDADPLAVEGADDVGELLGPLAEANSGPRRGPGDEIAEALEDSRKPLAILLLMGDG